MFELISIFLAFIGSLIAGLWDLFTTEVPDEILALMVSFGIGIWFFSGVATGNFIPLAISLITGTTVLVFGWILYKKGQWGGADAWLLAGFGYLIPFYNNQLFMPVFLFNLLVVGSLYMIGYSLVLGIKNVRVFSYFIKDLKENWKIVFIPSFFVLIVVMSTLIMFPIRDIFYALFPVLIIFMIIFWRYGVVIEKRVFRKRIKTRELKVGDVVEDMIWRGINAHEIKALQKKKKYVVIKEGIRFIPAFLLALIATLLYGNLMFLFFSF